jgi:hypothetical protein
MEFSQGYYLVGDRVMGRLQGAIDNDDTTLALSSGHTIPSDISSTTPLELIIIKFQDNENPKYEEEVAHEVVLAESITGDDVTLFSVANGGRGRAGTTATSFGVGDWVFQYVSASLLKQLQERTPFQPILFSKYYSY